MSWTSRKRPPRSGLLPLAGFHPRVLLIDDIDPPAAAHDAAVLVPDFGRAKAVADSHGAETWLGAEIEGREVGEVARKVN